MKIFQKWQDHFDVEIGEKVYRLTGELSIDRIYIFKKYIGLVVAESIPISESRKKEMSGWIDQSESSKELVAWLSNPDIVIDAYFQDISEQEKIYVIETVCEEWNDDKCPIYFIDDNYNVIRKSKTAK